MGLDVSLYLHSPPSCNEDNFVIGNYFLILENYS